MVRVFLSAGQDLTENPDSMLNWAIWVERLSQRMRSDGLSIRNSLSLWLIREFSQECSAQRIAFDSNWWITALSRVLTIDGSWKVVQYLLEICPRETIPEAVYKWLSCSKLDETFSTEIVVDCSNKIRLIQEKLQTLHFKSQFDDRPAMTPTLAAMRLPDSFELFRRGLIEMNYGIDQFIKEEIRVIGAETGWTTSTLYALFTIEYQPPRLTPLSCRLCNTEAGDPDTRTYHKIPIWNQWVSRIKKGEDLYAPILLDESSDDDGFKEMRIWFFCQWGKGIEERRQKESKEEQEREEEGSMFLLNIDM